MSVAGFKLTIWIPVEQVGIVIGRSGATISRIQSSSSSRLNVVPDPEASPWAPVYIKGAPDGVFMAAKLVSDLVEELDDAVAEFHLSAKGRDKLRAGGPDDGLGNLSPEARRISAELGVRIVANGAQAFTLATIVQRVFEVCGIRLALTIKKSSTAPRKLLAVAARFENV